MKEMPLRVGGILFFCEKVSLACAKQPNKKSQKLLLGPKTDFIVLQNNL